MYHPGVARLQAVLANRKYSYGGQLPSDIENQSKTQSFGNMVGGGIDAMQRIFSGGNGNSGTGGNSTSGYAIRTTASGNGNGMSGIQRYQAIASRTMGGTPNSNNNFSSDAPTYDNPSSSSSIPTRQENPASPFNNRGNLYIAQDALGYNTPMSAEDQIKLASKYMDKNLEKETAITGIASLTNAFGKTGGFSTVFGSYTPR